MVNVGGSDAAKIAGVKFRMLGVKFPVKRIPTYQFNNKTRFQQRLVVSKNEPLDRI